MAKFQLNEDKHTSGVYFKRDITIVRGKGALVWDENGNEYIDCVSGQGVANIGHCHPELVQTIEQQSNMLITCPEIFYNDQRSKLLTKLSELSPGNMQRIFLCNSGTEAIEASIKFARLSTKKTKIISALRSFHGRTMGSLSLTGQKKYSQPFAPLLPGITQIPYNNVEKLTQTFDDDTAAVIMEVIQGEGGVRLGDRQFLETVQELCNTNEALFIIDEVQTGLGRTGKLFATEHFNLKPDILCIAKSLGGGIPMGATILGSRIQNIHAGSHGTTFGGNPLACAAGNTVLDIINDKKLLADTINYGEYITECLKKQNLSNIREVRGLGLMIGIELKHKVTPVLKELQNQGILALPAGNTVLRLLPPLVITKDQVQTVTNAIIRILTNIS
tara:strand:- start:1440 stop:2606 length:1167 start_codon:yes stop_codon:yes gene_type:complete